MPAREIALAITADPDQVFDSLLERSLSGGAARGIRTPDPVITNDVLYRLSYCGEPCRGRREPAPIRALLISGMARIGKDKPAPKCASRAPTGPESAPAAGLGLCMVPG